MGGRGAYLQSGGFKIQEYEATGETIGGIKVIQHKTKTAASLPEMSNTPGTAYILKSGGRYTTLGVYGNDRRLKKSFDITHGHKNRPKNGTIERLKMGIAHVHNINGGREANVRYMTLKEIKNMGRLSKEWVEKSENEFVHTVRRNDFHAVNFDAGNKHYTFSGWWLLEWDNGEKFYDSKEEFLNDSIFDGRTAAEAEIHDAVFELE